MTVPQLEGLTTAEELAAAARSSLYSLLAEALAFPSAELAGTLASGREADEIARLAAALPFHLSIWQRGLADAVVTPAVLEQEYIGLFEVGPGGPPCPLYEGSHRSGRMRIMEELVRFYEHFGLRTMPGDQPDHLCAELEFMHYLSFKEAASLRAGGPTSSYRLAQHDFLSRHLCRWLPQLRARLEHLHASPTYRELMGLADDFCARDLSHLRHDGGASREET